MKIYDTIQFKIIQNNLTKQIQQNKILWNLIWRCNLKQLSVLLDFGSEQILITIPIAFDKSFVIVNNWIFVYFLIPFPWIYYPNECNTFSVIKRASYIIPLDTILSLLSVCGCASDRIAQYWKSIFWHLRHHYLAVK